MKRAIAAAMSLLIGACDPGPPTGQVLARVEGVDVTRRDVLIESTESGFVPASDADHAAQDTRALLDRVIARRLLAAEARRLSVDRSPEFLGQQQRNRELILGDHLIRRLAGRVPPASEARVRRYAAAHDAAFAGRRMLSLDRIVTDAEAERVALADLPDLDAVERWLAAHDRPYRRLGVVIDSLYAPAAKTRALELAVGHPVIDREGIDMVIDHLTATTPAPVPLRQRLNLAATMLERQDYQELQAATLRTLRTRSSVVYASPAKVR